MPFNEITFHYQLNRPGTIIDVGANRGSMSIHFSSWECNRLIAFEPVPAVNDDLVRNLSAKHGGRLPDRVEVRREALGDRPGIVVLRVPRTKEGLAHEWSSVVKTFADLKDIEVLEISVPMTTIDAFGLFDVSAMKIDAEGFEQEVLIGGRQTILRCRPIISVELEERHRTGCTYFVPGFLAALGYEGYWYDQRKDEFRPISEFDRLESQQAGPAPTDKLPPFYVWTFYFIPMELPDLRLRLAKCAPIRIG